MGSELAEASSLLSLAMPAANVNFLLREDGGGDEAAVAIEVRPRRRVFTTDDAVPEMGKDDFQCGNRYKKGSTVQSDLDPKVPNPFNY